MIDLVSHEIPLFRPRPLCAAQRRGGMIDHDHRFNIAVENLGQESSLCRMIPLHNGLNPIAEMSAPSGLQDFHCIIGLRDCRGARPILLLLLFPKRCALRRLGKRIVIILIKTRSAVPPFCLSACALRSSKRMRSEGEVQFYSTSTTISISTDRKSVV